MPKIRMSALALALLAAWLFNVAGVQAIPQSRGGGTRKQTPQQQAAAIPQGISKATDGSTILDTTANVNGLALRFKVSGPANMFTTLSNVTGGVQSPGTPGPMGLNVLLHGDGGDSFFKFPNQAVQGNLMGVVVLAPSEQLLWGQNTGQPSGLSRKNGATDSQAVADLVQKVLPQMVAFNQSNVFFTGVSGGSLTLSGFFVPAQLSKFAGPGTTSGVLLMCGALAPQVDIVDAASFMAKTPIHYQSTKQELSSLQPAIPKAIKAYEQAAAALGLTPDQIGKLHTVDNTPNGGHCEFDEQGFSSGIQLISNNFENIMQGGSGAVKGINAPTVLTPVVGHENVQFAQTRGNKRRDPFAVTDA